MRQLLNKLSIRVQIIIPVIVALTFLATGVMFSSTKIKSAFQSVSVSAKETIIYKDNLTTIVDNIYAMRISAIYSLFEPSELNVLSDNLRKNEQANLKLLNNIDHLNGVQEEVKALKSTMHNYVNYSIHTMRPLLKEKHERLHQTKKFEHRYELACIQYRKFGKEMVEAIHRMSTQLNSRSLNALHLHEKEHTNAIDYSIMGLIFILLLSILTGWILSNWIVSPIHRLQTVMRNVAKGDLTTSVCVSGNNELSALSTDVNTTIIQLKSTVNALTRISINVASAATELATVMTQSTINVEQEKNEMAQVSSAILQLEVTANSVTENAQEADASSENANQLVINSIAMFEHSFNATQEMTEQLRNAALTVAELNDQSDKIGRFIEVIEGISEQTNLLALNAAIEAARAGESGRGFSVVADEVRVLASRTQESTREVQSIINELQQKSAFANNSMMGTLSSIEKNNNITTNVKTSLDDISNSIANLNSINSRVATSAEEQRQVTADISRNVTTIHELTNQNATGIIQSAAASQELSNLAEQQNHKLKEFKVL